MESVKLKADRIRVNGPKVDGSFSIAVDVGEYEQRNVAMLLGIPQNTVVEVTIKQIDE